jgi:DNA-directed RNA polymerase subunit RPC12/RpoP
MLTDHKCSRCQHEFALTSNVFLKTGWGRSVASLFKSLGQQLNDYQKVVCPKCGQVDQDDRIFSYGLFKPHTVIYLVLAIMAVLFIVDFFHK